MFEFLNPRVAYESLVAFVSSGGPVLIAILGLTFVLWALILERALYWTTAHSSTIARAKRAWAARKNQGAWAAEQLRSKLISEAKLEAAHFNGIIKVLVSVVPLLGLLGTVTGMVYVFDIMAVTGSSNARLMAEGISRATLPTMAGLFTSVSGVMFTYWYERFVEKAVLRLHDELR